VHQLRLLVQAGLMAAFIAVGALIALPMPGIPVPIVLQTFFIYLTGLLLGARWGTVAVTVYLVAGACGLPVFAGGSGGVARLVGPTGGFLVGFVPGVAVIGALAARLKGAGGELAAMAGGTAVIYLPGVLWLSRVTGMSPVAAAAAMVPFLAGDALKMAAALPVARTLRPLAGRGNS
jgi:biotin transport system substrate-specific component